MKLAPIGARLLGLFSSLGLSCVLLCTLGLLTWLGTLAQVEHGLYEVQKKYFESLFLLQEVGPVSIPLPGGGVVMGLLFLNLIIGGLIRMRRSRAVAGVMLTHVGIALLLVAGFVKLRYSQDGHVTFYEGESANHFESYFRWELVVWRETDDGAYQEFLVPDEVLRRAGDEPVRITSAELPFELELSHWMGNCAPMPKGPMFEVDVPVVEGVFLDEKPRAAKAEQNLAGTYARVVHADGRREETALWGVQAQPWTVSAAGERWAVDLRKERYPMPFTVRLEDFMKEDHPGTNMPSWFSSDVTVSGDESSRPVRISMNQPLRDGGLVLYQASWGPSNARPGERLFSTLAVVRNPADQWPLYACIVIALGLVAHFAKRLVRYVRVEVGRA